MADPRLVAAARFAAYWWEKQVHPIELERAGRWFVRYVVSEVGGASKYADVFGDVFDGDVSEEQFARLVRLGQDARRL